MSELNAPSRAVGPLLPTEHEWDMCGFLSELSFQLATAQTTQDVEVEQKHQDLLQLKV